MPSAFAHLPLTTVQEEELHWEIKVAPLLALRRILLQAQVPQTRCVVLRTRHEDPSLRGMPFDRGDCRTMKLRKRM